MWNVWKLEQLLAHCHHGPQVGLRDSLTGATRWVPARPESGFSRWRAAWEVLLGRADAFTWPEDDRR